jgi:hypothetical protein
MCSEGGRDRRRFERFVVKEQAMETRALPFAIATAMCLLVAQAHAAPARHDPGQASHASGAGSAGGFAYYNDGFDPRRSPPGPTDPHGPAG